MEKADIIKVIYMSMSCLFPMYNIHVSSFCLSHYGLFIFEIEQELALDAKFDEIEQKFGIKCVVKAKEYVST